MATTATATMTTTTPISSGDAEWLNDQYQDKVSAFSNILDGISFWAKKTPKSGALVYPHDSDADVFEIVTWNEYEQAIVRAAEWLRSELNLPVPAAEDPKQSVITLLISPSHDNMCLWMALARMGYTTQFISPAHLPSVIATLIYKAESRAVIHSGLNADWILQSKGELLQFQSNKTAWIEMPEEMSLNGLVRDVRTKLSLEVAERSRDPVPFVMMHSFGSTSIPKLYPLGLDSANLSAEDAAKWWIGTPVEQRWRCQLQTSLPFHFSFQNPIWRALKCGTKVAFPLVRPPINGAKGQQLVPSACDVLDSLYYSHSDILYASPSALENMLETASYSNKPEWKQAVKDLKEAHSGGAPTSFEKADLFKRHGLMVMQVFATTEAGMIFVGKPNLTGHLCHLTPRPHLKEYLLFEKDPTSPEVLQLWLPENFPGLVKRDLKFEPLPSNPSIQAWNTNDTFRRLPSPPGTQLYAFVGRADDWLRLTVGTACRALEIESRFAEIMRSKVGWERIEQVTALGNARKALSVVVQNKDGDKPNDADREAAKIAAETVTKEQLQYPAVLKAEAVLFTSPDQPIHVTQKGNLQRKKNEEEFASLLAAHGL